MDHERTDRLSLATLPDCVFRADLALRLQEVSAAASIMLGIPAAALVGTPLQDLVTADDLARLEDLIRHALSRTDRTQSLLHQTRLRHADGRLIPVEIHSRLVLGDDGEPVGVVGVARDLRSRLRDQAAALARERQRQRDRKHAALARLAAVVGDDLAALLDGLAGQAGLADGAALASARDRAARRLEQLRQIAGRLPTRREDRDVDATVARIVTDLRDGLPLEARLVHEPGCGGAVASLDADLLRQALGDLVANAREAATGGGQITVYTRLEPAPRTVAAMPAAPASPSVLISVHDTGPGLDAANRERADEPFYTTRPGAAGLGLTRVRAIAAAHDGRLQLETGPHGGAVATLSLPARHGAPPLAVAPAPARPGRSVMVVDDDPEILRYVERVLGAERLHVVACADGVDALAHLASGEPVDLVVLDWALPGLDGRRVREQVLRRQPRIPLLVISGHAREEYTALGGVDPDTPWLVKPFTPGELRAAVAGLLARRGAASGS